MSAALSKVPPRYEFVYVYGTSIVTHESNTVPCGVKLIMLPTVVVPAKLLGKLPERSDSSSSAILTSVSLDNAPAGNSIAILLPLIDGKSLLILVFTPFLIV